MGIDERLQQGSFELGDLSLCRVYLKDHMDYPWLVLVPLIKDVSELYQLTEPQQSALMSDITQASQLIKQYFVVDKINVATLGNMVSQLHIHVVGRRGSDPLWPHGIWQAELLPNPYPSPISVIADLKQSRLFKNSS